MCFKLNAKTDAELNKITVLSLIINKSQLGYVLNMFLRSGSISASTFLSKEVLKKTSIFKLCKNFNHGMLIIFQQ